MLRLANIISAQSSSFEPIHGSKVEEVQEPDPSIHLGKDQKIHLLDLPNEILVYILALLPTEDLMLTLPKLAHSNARIESIWIQVVNKKKSGDRPFRSIKIQTWREDQVFSYCRLAKEESFQVETVHLELALPLEQYRILPIQQPDGDEYEVTVPFTDDMFRGFWMVKRALKIQKGMTGLKISWWQNYSSQHLPLHRNMNKKLLTPLMDLICSRKSITMLDIYNLSVGSHVLALKDIIPSKLRSLECLKVHTADVTSIKNYFPRLKELQVYATKKFSNPPSTWNDLGLDPVKMERMDLPLDALAPSVLNIVGNCFHINILEQPGFRNFCRTYSQIQDLRLAIKCSLSDVPTLMWVLAQECLTLKKLELNSLRYSPKSSDHGPPHHPVDCGFHQESLHAPAVRALQPKFRSLRSLRLGFWDRYGLASIESIERIFRTCPGILDLDWKFAIPAAISVVPKHFPRLETLFFVVKVNAKEIGKLQKDIEELKTKIGQVSHRILRMEELYQ